MANLTVNLNLRKPVVNIERDWGVRHNENWDILDDAVLTSNLTGKGNVAITDDGSGNVTVSGSSDFPGDVTIAGDLTVDGSALFVDTVANRVGINTTNPQEALHVNGTILRLSNTLGAAIDIDSVTGVQAFRFKDNAVVKWEIQNTTSNNLFIGPLNTPVIQLDAGVTQESIRISSAGNVGIGAAPGAFQLDVAGTGRFVEAVISENLTVDTDTLVVVAATNRVGINIQSPDETLHVLGATSKFTSGSAQRVTLDSTTDAQKLAFSRSGTIKWQIGNDSLNVFEIRDDTTNEVTLSIKSHADNENAIVVTSGNVGIGAAPGAFKLDVAGDELRLKNSADAPVELHLDGGTSSSQLVSIFFTDRGTKQWEILKTVQNEFTIFDSVNFGIPFRITQDGSNGDVFTIANGAVGIGALPDGSFKLDVAGAGTARFSTSIESPIGTFADSLTISGVPVSISDGVTDHGALTGLADDDHTQYSLVDGTRIFTGDVTVGDGTTATQTLEIDADTTAQLTFSNSGVQQWIINNAAGFFKITDIVNFNSPFTIAAGAGGGAMQIDGSGNMGIGIAPSFKLDVNGDVMRVRNFADAGAVVIIDSGDTTAQNTTLSFRDRGTQKYLLRAEAGGNFVLKDNVQNHNILTVVTHSGNTDALHISGGNVGIGGTPGGFQLDVAGNTRIAGDLNVGSGADAAQTLTINSDFLSKLVFADSGIPKWRLDNNSNNLRILDESNATVPIFIAPGAGNNDSIVILGGGEVGIGASPGSFQLDVAGAGRFKDTLEVETTTGAFVPPRLTNTQKDSLSPAASWMIWNTSSGTLNMYDGTSWKTVAFE